MSQNQIFFYALFAVISAAVLWMIGDYLGVIAFSLVMLLGATYWRWLGYV